MFSWPRFQDVLKIITVELGHALTSQLHMKNIKVIPANQDNGQPQLRKSLFGKAGELFSGEFSARVLKIFTSQGLSLCGYTATGLLPGFPE